MSDLADIVLNLMLVVIVVAVMWLPWTWWLGMGLALAALGGLMALLRRMDVRSARAEREAFWQRCAASRQTF